MSLEHPEIAAELLRHLPALNLDIGHLSADFDRFCALIDTDPAAFKGLGKRNRRKAEIRRLFAALIVHTYSPQSYSHPRDSMTFTYGLAAEFSRIMGVGRPDGCRLLREVVAHEKVYDSFRSQVSDIVERFNNKTSL